MENRNSTGIVTNIALIVATVILAFMSVFKSAIQLRLKFILDLDSITTIIALLSLISVIFVIKKLKSSELIDNISGIMSLFVLFYAFIGIL